jgi:hypothetical protein
MENRITPLMVRCLTCTYDVRHGLRVSHFYRTKDMEKINDKMTKCVGEFEVSVKDNRIDEQHTSQRQQLGTSTILNYITFFSIQLTAL